MNAYIADRMLADILKADGFQIRKEKSVLYGICKNCI